MGCGWVVKCMPYTIGAGAMIMDYRTAVHLPVLCRHDCGLFLCSAAHALGHWLLDHPGEGLSDEALDALPGLMLDPASLRQGLRQLVTNLAAAQRTKT